MNDSQIEYLYDKMIDLHNDLMEKGFEEIEVLEYFRGWIISSINNCPDDDISNSEKYLKLKRLVCADKPEEDEAEECDISVDDMGSSTGDFGHRELGSGKDEYPDVLFREESYRGKIGMCQVHVYRDDYSSWAWRVTANKPISEGKEDSLVKAKKSAVTTARNVR